MILRHGRENQRTVIAAFGWSLIMQESCAVAEKLLDAVVKIQQPT